jgi:hypothetical protein
MTPDGMDEFQGMEKRTLCVRISDDNFHHGKEKLVRGMEKEDIAEVRDISRNVPCQLPVA